MGALARSAFLPPVLAEHAGLDAALPIGFGQTISQPSIVLAMTLALGVTPRAKVLEIGTGSGYQAALLASLARRVYTIERIKALAELAEARLRALGLWNVTTRLGDGALGWPEQARFDRILVTAACPDLPAPLLDQLVEGGVLVAPVGPPDGVQDLVRVVRTAVGVRQTRLAAVRFVPLLRGSGSASAHSAPTVRSR